MRKGFKPPNASHLTAMPFGFCVIGWGCHLLFGNNLILTGGRMALILFKAQQEY